jgi:hypothetical protein
MRYTKKEVEESLLGLYLQDKATIASDPCLDAIESLLGLYLQDKATIASDPCLDAIESLLGLYLQDKATSDPCLVYAVMEKYHTLLLGEKQNEEAEPIKIPGGTGIPAET